MQDQANIFTEVIAFTENFGFIFFLIILAEAIWEIYTHKRDKKESLANLAIFGVGLLLERTFFGLVFVYALFFVKTLIPWTLPTTWWTWLLALIIADFIYYWMHRWEHEVRFLWAYHSVHHSSHEFNLSTAIRLSWVSALFEWVFFIPMLILGFGVMQTFAVIAIVNVYASWVHTEKIGKLGWLDRILVTPSNHRVHHGSNPQYIDKNYGGMFIFWDILFGTYEDEVEAVRYGLTKQIGTSNPIYINFYEYWQMIKDVNSAKTRKQKWKYIFGRTGWKAEKKKTT